MSEVTIGFDPEVFWKKGDKLISVIGKLGGTKQTPRKVNDIVSVLEDNVAAEFNSPPCVDADSFINAIDKNLTYLAQVAKQYGCELATNVTSGRFEIDQLRDPGAFIFGCEPDFNAWTGEVNLPPMDDDPFLRSCGGHVHVGFEGIDPNQVVRAMDLFIGVPSVFLDKDIDRKRLYGKAGACRYKPYGVEYRTASNWWIWKKETVEWMFKRVQAAVEYARNNNIAPGSGLATSIQRAINYNSVDTAKNIMHHFPQIQV